VTQTHTTTPQTTTPVTQTHTPTLQALNLAIETPTTTSKNTITSKRTKSSTRNTALFEEIDDTWVEECREKVKELYKSGKNNVFEETEFILGEKIKRYTAVVNFFDGPKHFDFQPNRKTDTFDYKCMVCGAKRKLFKRKVPVGKH
jgi:rubredoxin